MIRRNAQALLEITILASLFVFLLATLVRVGASMTETQNFYMETFRDAVAKASSKDASQLETKFSGKYFKNIRLPDVETAGGVPSLQELVSQWSVTRSSYMNFAQSLDKRTASRQHYLLGSDGGRYTDIKRPGVDGDPEMSGFLIEGYRQAVQLPYYDIAGTEGDAYGGSCPAEGYRPAGQVYCLKQQINDPDDEFPKDNRFWSWAAICSFNFDWTNAGSDKRTCEVPFLRESCMMCLEDFQTRSFYVADGNTTGDSDGCHPPSSSDALDGVREYSGSYQKSQTRVFIQPNYDPSVPLDNSHIVKCDVNENGLEDDGASLPCGTLLLTASESDKRSKWFEIDVKHLPGSMEEQPFLSRGKQVWIEFSKLRTRSGGTWDSLLTRGEADDAEAMEPLRYQRGGATFKILALEAFGANASAYDSSTKSVSNCVDKYCCGEHNAHQAWPQEEDGQVKYKFHLFSGMTLAHAIWADINLGADRARIPDQGIREYRLRTDVGISDVTTKYNPDTGTVSTATEIQLKDTIRRTIRTSPHGDLNGNEYEVIQERTVGTGADKSAVWYDYEQPDAYEESQP